MANQQALTAVRLAVLLACLSAMGTTLAEVNESFTFQPGYSSYVVDSPQVLFLWAQTGFVGLKQLPVGGTATSSDMALSRAHPAAETALLDWDNATTTTTTTATATSSNRSSTHDVSFKYCSSSQRCEGSLILFWSNDSIVWQPLWNHTFTDLPSHVGGAAFGNGGTGCTWEAVTVPIPAAAAAAARVAFKWVHQDASPGRASTSHCSGNTLLDDIILPVKPPSAANIEYGKAPLATAKLTVANCSACEHLCGTG
jgi:hypothetical protein